MKFYFNYKAIFLEVQIEEIQNDFYIKKITFIKQSLKNNESFWDINIKNFINKIKQYFKNYFIYKQWKDPPNFLLYGTTFQKQVWQTLLTIPLGHVVSYKTLAEMCGYHQDYARAVGNACNHNPIPIIVPCHRVIGENGSLKGYAGGIDIKRWLLNHEGYQI